MARGTFKAPESIDGANAEIAALFAQDECGCCSTPTPFSGRSATIAIKHALARADMPLSPAQACQWAEDAGFALMQSTVPHLLTLEQLPLHHRDPSRCAEDSVFHRLLVAQAMREGLTLLRDAWAGEGGGRIALK